LLKRLQDTHREAHRQRIVILGRMTILRHRDEFIGQVTELITMA
jgi:hypothetical protein